MRKDYRLEKRKYIIGGFIIVIVAIYMIRLFNLQVMENDYKQFADSNAFMRKTLYPSRGMMHDRNDKLAVKQPVRESRQGNATAREDRWQQAVPSMPRL